jgi:hypothetical protein
VLLREKNLEYHGQLVCRRQREVRQRCGIRLGWNGGAGGGHGPRGRGTHLEPDLERGELQALRVCEWGQGGGGGGGGGGDGRKILQVRLLPTPLSLRFNCFGFPSDNVLAAANESNKQNRRFFISPLYHMPTNLVGEEGAGLELCLLLEDVWQLSETVVHGRVPCLEGGEERQRGWVR